MEGGGGQWRVKVDSGGRGWRWTMELEDRGGQWRVEVDSGVEGGGWRWTVYSGVDDV